MASSSAAPREGKKREARACRSLLHGASFSVAPARGDDIGDRTIDLTASRTVSWEIGVPSRPLISRWSSTTSLSLTTICVRIGQDSSGKS